MSTTIYTCTATCKINAKTAGEAIELYLDWLENNEDEIPISFEEETRREMAEDLSAYVSMNEEGELVLAMDTDGDGNYDSSIFDSLTGYFKTIQTSDFMVVNWATEDSKHGTSSGTDYYDKDGYPVDMHDWAKDKAALDQIASVLSGKSWDVDMLMSISDIITSTGRVIEDV